MVEEIYPIRQTDTVFRLKHHDKEIIPDYRDLLEIETKDIIWALNEVAVTNDLNSKRY